MSDKPLNTGPGATTDKASLAAVFSPRMLAVRPEWRRAPEAPRARQRTLTGQDERLEHRLGFRGDEADKGPLSAPASNVQTRSPLDAALDLGFWATAAGVAALLMAPAPFFWHPPAWVLHLMQRRR